MEKVNKVKSKTIRRRNRSKGPNSVPKVILKWKKSTNYWLWATPIALFLLFFLLLGYNQLLQKVSYELNRNFCFSDLGGNSLIARLCIFW